MAPFSLGCWSWEKILLFNLIPSSRRSEFFRRVLDGYGSAAIRNVIPAFLYTFWKYPELAHISVMWSHMPCSSLRCPPTGCTSRASIDDHSLFCTVNFCIQEQDSKASTSSASEHSSLGGGVTQWVRYRNLDMNNFHWVSGPELLLLLPELWVSQIWAWLSKWAWEDEPRETHSGSSATTAPAKSTPDQIGWKTRVLWILCSLPSSFAEIYC